MFTKFIWSLYLVIVSLTCSHAFAGLVAGDVAILGFRGDEVAGTSEEGFAWVALADLDPGQILTFTDLGWASDGSGFFGNEGAIDFTVGASGISAGTLLQLDFDRTGNGTDAGAYTFQNQSNSTGANLGVYSNANLAGELGLLPATSGDNLFVFDGTRVSPNFLYGIRTEGGAWQTEAGPSTANDDNDDSALPAALANANTALGGPGLTDNTDNARYIGTTTGTRTELLAALMDSSNWETSDIPSTFGSDLSNGLIGSGQMFSITAVPEPSGLLLLCMASGFLIRRNRNS